MAVPSSNVITPNSPLGPAVDIVIGSNKAMTTPLSGAMTTPMLSQQGILSNNVVDCPKLQHTFDTFNKVSLDKNNKSVVVFKAIGGGLGINSKKIGSKERGR